MATYLYLDQDDADTLDDLIAMEQFVIAYNKVDALPWACSIGSFQGKASTLRDAIRSALGALFHAANGGQGNKIEQTSGNTY